MRRDLRYLYCAVCGKRVPGDITEPENSGYGYGRLVACSWSHQRVLEQRYRERDKARLNGPVKRPSAAEHTDRILALQAQGKSAQDIALEVGLSPATVYTICNKHNSPFPRSRRQ